MLTGANGNYVPTPRTSVLTVFKDGDTGAVYFKDNQGNEEPLSAYAGGGGGGGVVQQDARGNLYETSDEGLGYLANVFNADYWSYSLVLGGRNNKLLFDGTKNIGTMPYKAFGSVMLGGRNNYFSAQSTVAGGAYNYMYAVTVIGGFDHQLSGSGLNVIGGKSHYLKPAAYPTFDNVPYAGYNNSIIGGTQHRIESQYLGSNMAFIGGGQNGTIGSQSSGSHIAVIGGQSLIVNTGYGSSSHSSMIGGTQNQLRGAQRSAIIGGANNQAYGLGCAIIGGWGGRVNNNYSTILGGSTLNQLISDRDDCVFVNNISIKNIPTASAGLPAGSVWSNAGVLNIV